MLFRSDGNTTTTSRMETSIRRTRHLKKNQTSIDEIPDTIIGLIIMLIKNPLLSLRELELCADEARTIKSLLIFVIAGAGVTAISFNNIMGKFITGLIGLFGDFLLFLGTGYMSASNSAELAQDILEVPFIQDTGFKIILYPVLSHAILICIMCVFVIGVFKVIRKEDIGFIDCFRLMLTPLAILLVGKMIVLLLAVISGTVAAYFYVLMMFAVVAITILHFINFLGKSSWTIYTMPLIYLISALIRNGIILQLIKISMSRYALYF